MAARDETREKVVSGFGQEEGNGNSGDGPVIVVERLQLGEVAVEGGNVPRSYAPERANLKDLPW